MNKYYISLALLMSACSVSLIKSVEVKECATLWDAAYEKSCSCAEVDKIGKCAAGAYKADKISREYYCKCLSSAKSQQKNDQQSNSLNKTNQGSDNQSPKEPNNTFDFLKNYFKRQSYQQEEQRSNEFSEYKKEPEIEIVGNGAVIDNLSHSDIYIFSQDINAPIYNLPMQRALIPLSHGIIDCPWFVSIAPYGKTTQKQSINDVNLENTEGGTLIHGGYYGSWWFANTIVSLGGTKTAAKLGDGSTSDEFYFGVNDALFGLGLKTDNSDSNLVANGEWFFGVSANRLDDNDSKSSIKKFVFDVGNLSTGIQGDVDWTFATFQNCKFELSVFSRFTHFFKKNIKIKEQNFSYTPGSYVDLLLGLTQYYGSDYQHQFELGYNPTICVIKAATASNTNNGSNEANLNQRQSGKTGHSIYATYSYNWDINCMPMNFSFGGSATVTSHTNTYGTIFGTFGLAF